MENRMNENGGMAEQEMKQNENLKPQGSTLYRVSVIAGILLAIFYAIAGLAECRSAGDAVGIILGMPIMFFLVGGVPYGWVMVSRITKYIEWFLLLPIIGWLVYYALKLMAAAYIGWFFFIRDIIRNRKQRKMQKETVTQYNE